MKNTLLLKKYALNYLAKYDSSKKNLFKVLQKKIRNLKIDEKEKKMLFNSINNILIEFESKKLIDDQNYSIRKIENYSSQGKSKKFIENYLLYKGIDKKILNEIFENFEIDNPDWETESAKIFIRKKIKNYESKEDLNKNLAKMARSGFNYSIIKKTLKM
jgi:Uncharacterized protein conserved in bacteria